VSKALVLGGGGPVGIAWESGLLNGLADGGVDVSTADFTMGTSAGSFVGARLAMGVDPRTFAEPFINPAVGETRDDRPPRASGPPADLSALTKLMAEAQNDPQNGMKRLGAFALNANTISEADFIETFGSAFRELPDDAWPQRAFACTAVDTATGDFALWTADSKVGIKYAVSSSCSVPGIYPPVTINGRRYMDGGMRSTINADMAKGYDKVLVVVVRGDAPGAMGERMRARREAEFQILRDAGAEVRMIGPNAESLAAMGANLMDFRKRGPAAAAGLAQGRAEAAAFTDFWR
jgi:NTE family protein